MINKFVAILRSCWEEIFKDNNTEVIQDSPRAEFLKMLLLPKLNVSYLYSNKIAIFKHMAVCNHKNVRN